MRGELDNVTVAESRILLDVVQGGPCALRLLHEPGHPDARV